MMNLVHLVEQHALNTWVSLAPSKYKTYFDNYNESITPCFSVLANMLMKSGINPFDSQEAKPYKNDNEIVAMTNLVTAYQV